MKLPKRIYSPVLTIHLIPDGCLGIREHNRPHGRVEEALELRVCVRYLPSEELGGNVRRRGENHSLCAHAHWPLWGRVGEFILAILSFDVLQGPAQLHLVPKRRTNGIGQGLQTFPEGSDRLTFRRSWESRVTRRRRVVFLLLHQIQCTTYEGTPLVLKNPDLTKGGLHTQLGWIASIHPRAEGLYQAVENLVTEVSPNELFDSLFHVRSRVLE
mmetsp:Transcript_14428/g.27859  ORF Transcript_14428/g.27859 Transcript_14428/m.27859 type:complete len:214 (-) Transcript_14428:769-1410(-)